MGGDPSEDMSRPPGASNDFLDQGASVELVALVEVTEWLISMRSWKGFRSAEPRPCAAVVPGTVWLGFDPKGGHSQPFRHFFNRWCGWVNP